MRCKLGQLAVTGIALVALAGGGLAQTWFVLRAIGTSDSRSRHSRALERLRSVSISVKDV